MKYLVMAVLTITLLAGTSSLNALERLSQQGRWLVDTQGRVVLLHGANLQLPHAEKHGAGATTKTPQRLAAQGFNGVRLVFFLSQLMPQPGAIDNVYLDAIAATVADYRAAGVYVLLDFHQDEYGPAVGVRGFPEWATFAGGHLPKRQKFPAGYFSDPAIQTAFDNFWSNHPVPGTDKGVQDFYMDALAAVAARFRDETAVFGIDVMNEPFPGTRCNQPDPVSAHCPDLEKALLGPFYTRAGAVIGAAAPQTIAFVEPFMLQGALGVPMATPPAGAPALRGFSYHQYGTLKEIRVRGNRHAMDNAVRIDAAILNTEWGFTNDPTEWTAQAEELDDLLIPWLAWARGSFAPIVDSELPAGGNDNREATLRALARPYPRFTAGTPVRLSFDGHSGTLRYDYKTLAPAGKHLSAGLTEIMMPRANFPKGYDVAISGGMVVSAPNASLLQVRALPDAADVSISAVRKGALPALPVVVPTADPYAFLNTPKRPKATGPLSSQSLLGDLLGDSQARAILEGEIPELLKSPQIGMGSQMSLRALQAYVPALLSDETLARIDKALAALALKHSNP